MTALPTPWRATTARVRGRTYNALLTRLDARRRTESQRCPHAHRSQGAAQQCAEQALRRIQRETV